LIRWKPYRYMFDLMCTKCLRAHLKKLGIKLKGGRGPKSKKWDRDVKNRAGQRCELTGRKGRLVAHHLWSYTDYPELRHDTMCGVCILEKYHKQFHAEYGKKTTPDQFAEFISNLVNN